MITMLVNVNVLVSISIPLNFSYNSNTLPFSLLIIPPSISTRRSISRISVALSSLILLLFFGFKDNPKSSSFSSSSIDLRIASTFCSFSIDC